MDCKMCGGTPPNNNWYVSLCDPHKREYLITCRSQRTAPHRAPARTLHYADVLAHYATQHVYPPVDAPTRVANALYVMRYRYGYDVDRISRIAHMPIGVILAYVSAYPAIKRNGNIVPLGYPQYDHHARLT